MINYVDGDATYPYTSSGVIAHVCNNSGGWGAGFVLSISKRWAAPEREYRLWHAGGYEQPFELGRVQYVIPENPPYYVVANMIAQDGYSFGRRAIQYDHLRSCLEKVNKFAQEQSLPVHMPRIGAGLGGGSWEEIEPIIKVAMPDVQIWVYNYKK